MTAVLLKNPEERGLVERAPRPWRRNVLETGLTSSGRAAVEAVDGLAGAHRTRTRAECGTEEPPRRCSDGRGRHQRDF
ncbi:hypothetical protein [Nonomuraea longispora]|uniref:hypothetical protein n=1 Tax=Nonomuraea longispora TaxID=1848320 RepID=UPI0015F2B0C3|nr:hypothetical protein [Nonomuraea longispora]